MFIYEALSDNGYVQICATIISYNVYELYVHWTIFIQQDFFYAFHTTLYFDKLHIKRATEFYPNPKIKTRRSRVPSNPERGDDTQRLVGQAYSLTYMTPVLEQVVYKGSNTIYKSSLFIHHLPHEINKIKISGMAYIKL